MKKQILTLLTLSILVFIALASGDSDSNTNNSKSVEGWAYSSSEDKMQGDSSFYATIYSTNTFKFKFPYDGNNNKMKLQIRKSARSKQPDVILQIGEGQFMSTIQGGTVNIKFDDEKPVKYSFNGSSSGDSDIIFISKEKTIINKLKTTKSLMIEATFYQEGLNVGEFNVEGFEWTH